MLDRRFWTDEVHLAPIRAFAWDEDDDEWDDDLDWDDDEEEEDLDEGWDDEDEEDEWDEDDEEEDEDDDFFNRRRTGRLEWH